MAWNWGNYKRLENLIQIIPVQKRNQRKDLAAERDTARHSTRATRPFPENRTRDDARVGLAISTSLLCPCLLKALADDLVYGLWIVNKLDHPD